MPLPFIHKFNNILPSKTNEEYSSSSTTTSPSSSSLFISSGLTFDDGFQILVSAQKPLGMLLEERGGELISDNESEISDDIIERGGGGGCIVVEIDENGSAFKSGVRVGDWLVAVQNADVSFLPIEDILGRIGNAPRVVNLRFQRDSEI